MSTLGLLQSEELSDLILKWYETQKTRTNNNNEGPEIDVINLTWILKALGFKLDFMDFLHEAKSGEKSKEIHVELKCSVSGLVARLDYKLDACVCPKKNDDQAFWEVQGTAPSSEGQMKKEATSSSILPEVSEKCSLVSKAILNNLLKYYKDCISDGEREIAAEPIKKIKIPDMFVTSENKAVPVNKKPEVAESVEGKNLSQIPEINVTAEIQKQEIQSTSNETEALAESFIASIQSDKINIATSSPNEKTDDQQNRDANVFQALNEARAKIDQALLYMKFNVTQDLSMASTTILMTTPKVKNGPRIGTPGSLKRSVTATEITQHKASAQKVKQSTGVSRRSSFGIKPTTVNSPLMGTSALKRSNSMRGDTPRPRGTPKSTGIPTSFKATNISNSNLSTLSTSSSSIGSATSKGSSTKEIFLKPLPGSKKKIVPNAPSLIERFKMQNPVTPKK
uniref:CSON015451 protein n=1 Tax=Culicoides sonorensis TaxID=179676 RepID=A0A336MCZ7_CULSO